MKRFDIGGTYRMSEVLYWAERVGFTKSQAPYAAAKAVMLKTARKGAPVYPSEIRQALEHTQPHIFLDPNQGKLWEEAL